MSAEIPAILALFPEPSKAPVAQNEPVWLSASGPYPYDYWETEVPGSHPLDLVRAVKGVRGDLRWGPVFSGDLSSYNGDHSQAGDGLARKR